MPSKISPLAPKTLKKINSIEGISVSIAHCGLKKNNKDDLVLIKLDSPGKIFGTFTNSKTPGEPILWNKSILKFGKVSAILINSGNANVFNGKQGKISLLKIVKELSLKLKIPENQIFIASTGVIGVPLDEKKIIKKIPYLISNMKNDSDTWLSAAKAMMTTDTYPKTHSENILGKTILINGIAKGSGMIAPNMATMLAFIFTNIDFENNILKSKFFDLVDKTFNSITVDGDTSTSDMVLFFSVKSKEKKIKLTDKQKNNYFDNLHKLMNHLSEYIIKDGEGASKFLKINVSGAKDNTEAKKIAKSIANSPLFKTAMAGSDANWGRIIMAVGKTDADIDPQKITLKFGKYNILARGKNLITKNLKLIDKYLKNREIEIYIDLGNGKGTWKFLTCDFTKEYVTINTDYRS